MRKMIVGLHIDEERKYSLTKYTSKSGSKTCSKESDHNIWKSTKLGTLTLLRKMQGKKSLTIKTKRISTSLLKVLITVKI